VGPAVNVASWRRRRAPRARARASYVIVNSCMAFYSTVRCFGLPRKIKRSAVGAFQIGLSKKKVKAGKVLVKVLVAQGHDDGAAMPRGMQRQQQPVCSRRPFLLIVALLVSLYFFFFLNNTSTYS